MLGEVLETRLDHSATALGPCVLDDPCICFMVIDCEPTKPTPRLKPLLARPDGTMMMFAVTGCKTPTNQTDRGCGPDGPKQTYFHVSMEGWTTPHWPIWTKIQKDFPATAPESLGHIGYDGESGQYIASNVVHRAYQAEGLLLDVYNSYDVSWHAPGAYFDRISIVNTSDLTPCNEITLSSPEGMQRYLRATGDEDGVELVDGSLHPACFTRYFWLPPACRVETSNCLLFLTYATYELWVIMQRATIFNMPIVPANVREWGKFSVLPTQISCLFYWWEPDPTFLGLGAKMLLYPRYNRSSWEKGIADSASSRIRLEARRRGCPGKVFVLHMEILQRTVVHAPIPTMLC